MAVARQTLKVKTIDEITEMIKLCFDYVTTNLNASYLLSYLVLASELNLENIRLEQIPGESVYTNGVWIFKVNEEKTNQLLESVKF